MKQAKYDISVVIPVYNAENYIRQCFESLKKQTYDFSKIQVVLINDGSSDNSLNICKKYKEEFQNVILLDQKNKGVSSARNSGIKKAEGKYIMLLDSDDFISKNAINNIITFFNKNYDEIDLVTYPIYRYMNGRSSIHPRYENYINGTGIYDLNEYIHLNQNTVNIVIKNKFKNNILYNEKMHLSEDQNFNTEVLMKKQKIGFVKDAIYYYRRIGVGVSSIKNNPYYCFDDIMKYNEGLFKKYTKNQKIPKYIQSLVIHTINWRLNQDELFPYSLNEKDYNKAKERIFNLIKKIDADVIISSKNISLYNKIFFLKKSNRKLDLLCENDNLILKCENEIVYEDNKICIEVSKLKHKKGVINIYACLLSPFLKFTKSSFYLKKEYKNGNIKEEKLELINSNRLIKKCSEFEAISYNIELNLNSDKLKKVSIYAKTNNMNVPVRWKFNKFSSANVIQDKKAILYNKSNSSYLLIKNATIFTKISVNIKNDLRILKRNKVAFLYRILSRIYIKFKPIYLYNDRNNIIDNAFYQFKHDFLKKDNIKRYYVTSMSEKDLNKHFSQQERKNIIRFNSLKHKIMFLKCNKIFTSFVDLQIYCPYNKGIGYYKNIKKYDLVYLQHGILHANLLSMYSKEFKEIEKFVISSDFEKNNLKSKYNYLEEDFIKSTMPRMKSKKEKINNLPKNKILFAPSWRKYLIGELVGSKRDLITPIFKQSNFFININNFLKSEKLNNILEKEDLVFEFKLHPNFAGYKNLFYTNKRIKIIFNDVNLADYKIFITDFSSFQFDYIKLKRPIIYYLPDEKEFNSGMHTYRSLDLKYEEAFGKLCITPDELINNIEDFIKSNYQVSKKYQKRMENFFYDVKDPCQIIYKETKN